MKLQHYQTTHVGRVRHENQDSIFSIPEHGVFMVADGMGGEKAGAEASAQVIASVERVAREGLESGRIDTPKAMEVMVENALQEANRDVFDISVREPDKAGLGSTGSLVILHKGLYFVGQVGDSRVYMVRNGNVKQVTRDHTVVWTLYESGVLTRDQLETHPERHLLTQCVGSNKPLEVDIFEGRLQPGDMFLICSDGLTGYAGEDEVLQLLVDPVYTLEERGEKLLRAALLGGGGDNVSVVLFRVDEIAASDDWQPNETHPAHKATPMPGKYTIADMPPSQASGSSDPPPRPTSPFALVGVVVGLLIAAIVGYVLMPHKFTVRVGWAGAYELDQKILPPVVLGEDGKPIPGAVEVESGGKTLRLSLLRKHAYTVKVHLRGAVPVTVSIPKVNPPKEHQIQPTKAGRLDLKVEDSVEDASVARISSLQIFKIATEGEEQVYGFESDGQSRPAMEHDLDPAFQHRVTAHSTSQREFTKKVQIPDGANETLNITF